MARGSMKYNRDEWVKDLGDEIPMLKRDSFAEHILPNVNATHISMIRRRLEASGDLRAKTQYRRSRNGGPVSLWKDFDGLPSATVGHEDSVFRRLRDPISAIKREAAEVLGRKAITTFRMRPTRSTESDSSWNDTFRVDGYDVLNKTTAVSTEATTSDSSGVHECDVVYPAEFKKSRAPAEVWKNTKQLIGSMSHALWDNPCRRFMFGLTIEDNMARIWFFSRSAVVVSASFNFLLDVEFFIRFVVSMSFSSTDALGYDPTVKRVRLGEQMQYAYLVRRQWYVTVDSLSNLRSLRIIGRATRVWKVKKWGEWNDPDAAVFALKDFWLDQDAQTEKEIQDAIFNKINTVNDVGDVSNPQQYFMTILADEPVIIGNREDVSNDLPPSDSYRLVDPEDAKHEASVLSTEPATVRGAIGEVPSSTTRWARLYRGKKHRRVLFEEVGQCLDEVRDHQKLFGALIDAVEGLRILYSAGYVHRDISTGNVLLCGDQGKLSDLEYARPYEVLIDVCEMKRQTQLDVPSQKDFKTGTPAFMAIEIQAEQYQFLPPKEKKSSEELPLDDLDWGDTPAASSRQPQNEESNDENVDEDEDFHADVIHNYLHDLESVWWMANYALFSSAPCNPVPPFPDVTKQRDLHKQLFPHTTGACVARVKHLKLDGQFFHNATKILLRPLRPPARLMNAVRDEMILAYQKLYKDVEAFRIDHKFLPLYQSFCNAYLKAQQAALSRVLHINEVMTPPVLDLGSQNSTVGEKRKAHSADEVSERVLKRRSTPASRQPSGKENKPTRRSSRLANKSEPAD